MRALSVGSILSRPWLRASSCFVYLTSTTALGGSQFCIPPAHEAIGSALFNSEDVGRLAVLLDKHLSRDDVYLGAYLK
jgi:hypothetical protein